MNQKRYTAQFEIDSEIIKAKRDMSKLSASLEESEKKAAEHYLIASSKETDDGTSAFHRASGDELRRKSDKIKKRISTIEDVKIPSLSRTLAAFNTKAFPFMEDGGVVKQK
jgi:hypothetical protein